MNKKLRPNASQMKTLDCVIDFDPHSVKSADGAVYIEGYANTVDKDRVSEIVLPKAFEKSLPTYLENPVMLYQHNWDNVIGSIAEARITDKGLWVKGKVSNAKDVEDVKTKILEGSLRTFSIGYNEVDSIYDDKSQAKVIKELELLEISVVTIPANAQAKFKPVTEDQDPAPAEAEKATDEASGEDQVGKALVELAAAVHQQGVVIKELQSIVTKGNQTMKTKTDEVKKPEDETKKPEAQAAVEQKPTEEPKKEEKAEPSADLAQVIQMLQALTQEVAAIKEMCGSMGKEEASEQEQAPAAESEAAAPAADEAKSLVDGEMTDEELVELESITKELEELAE